MKTMTNHLKKDVNGIIKAVILMGFSAFYTYALVSGNVRQYVHPRIDTYLAFSAFVMWVMAGLYIVEHIKGAQHRSSTSLGNYKAYLFYIIPLVMAFALSPRTAPMNNGTLTTGIDESKSVVEETPSGGTELVNEDEGVDTSGIELIDGIIVMDEDHFYEDMNEIYANPERYVGIPIEVVGSVFKDQSQFGKNEFVPSRNLMTCCAADTVSIGLLCRYEKAEELEVGTWVKVKGKVDLIDFKGERMPIIQVKGVEITEKPIDEFIYPY